MVQDSFGTLKFDANKHKKEFRQRNAIYARERDITTHPKPRPSESGARIRSSALFICMPLCCWLRYFRVFPPTLSRVMVIYFLMFFHAIYPFMRFRPFMGVTLITLSCVPLFLFLCGVYPRHFS
jgi:hypothetical protein